MKLAVLSIKSETPKTQSYQRDIMALSATESSMNCECGFSNHHKQKPEKNVSYYIFKINNNFPLKSEFDTDLSKHGVIRNRPRRSLC